MSPTMMYLNIYEYCEEDILDSDALKLCNRLTNQSNIQTMEGSGDKVYTKTRGFWESRRWLSEGGRVNGDDGSVLIDTYI